MIDNARQFVKGKLNTRLTQKTKRHNDAMTNYIQNKGKLR